MARDPIHGGFTNHTYVVDNVIMRFVVSLSFTQLAWWPNSAQSWVDVGDVDPTLGQR